MGQDIKGLHTDKVMKKHSVKSHYKIFDTHGRDCIHAYTCSFKCPHRNKSSGVRPGDRGGHALGLPCPVHLSGYVASNHFQTFSP
jgi:hypothetical protein